MTKKKNQKIVLYTTTDKRKLKDKELPGCFFWSEEEFSQAMENALAQNHGRLWKVSVKAVKIKEVTILS